MRRIGQLPPPQTGKRVAYVMSRFPKISETFILNEMLELERLGVDVEVFALVRERPAAMHPEAAALVARAHYGEPGSARTLAANLRWLARSPRAYLAAWGRALRGNLRSPRFLLRTPVAVVAAARFAEQIERSGVEHVHAHYATHPALAAWVVHRLTGIPYSFTAHAHDIYVERPMLAEKIRRATFVACISDYNRALLTRLYGEQAAAKLVVVRCGVEPDTFAPAGGAPANAHFTVVCTASLEPYKGHRYLIEAVARLRRGGLALRLVLIGEGEERAAIERQVAAAGLDGEVAMAGAQPRARVRELLAAADAVALPSVITEQGKMEGIPVALMEALAMGLPVVATRISGIPELVKDGHTGLLVPERDPVALAGALARLAADRDLGRRLGAAGRDLVVREFDLRTNTRRLRELLLAEPAP